MTRHTGRFSVLAILLLTLSALALLMSCRGITGPSANPVVNQPGGAQPNGASNSSTAINHIVIMLQENRSFDHYFGKLGQYRALNGLPATDIDGLPPNASNPADDGTTITSFHMQSVCMENVTPAWNEAHGQANRWVPSSDTDFLMDGFVHTAAGLDKCCNINPHDPVGKRAMGYYDWNDLPYYYFMATQFATSDRFFAPAPAKSEINRMYMMAATSNGHAIEPEISSVQTIWALLERAGISWKIYVTDISQANNGVNPIIAANSPIVNSTYLGLFFGQFAQLHADHIVPLSQYFTDVQNGTLPQVSFIETGYFSGRDEHPGGVTAATPTSATNIQTGAAYVSNIINALMFSSSWKDSVFLLSWDEWGGTYDHVPPIHEVSPDGIPPQDLTQPNDVPGDFTRSGMRVPVIIISPFAKKNYVSHTPMDYTAFLKFVETRFGLQSLTARDAAQPDMSEFFDFTSPPWQSPPNPPAQPTNGTCDITLLP